MKITVKQLKTGEVLLRPTSLQAAHDFLELITDGDLKVATELFYLEIDKGGLIPENVRPIRSLFRKAHERRTQPQLQLL